MPGTNVCERRRLASNPGSRAGVALNDDTTLEKPRFARDRRFSLGNRDQMVTGIQEVKRSEERMDRGSESVWWKGLTSCS